MSGTTLGAIVAVVLGWLASGLGDLVDAIKKKERTAILKSAFGLLATTVGVGLLVASELGKGRAVADTACTLRDEASRNQAVLQRLLQATAEAQRFAVNPAPDARDQFQRRLRIIEGEPFIRALYAARAAEVAALPADQPKHVYTLYALMELCQNQRDRIVREVRLETIPAIQVHYLRELSESCDPLTQPFAWTINELAHTCSSGRGE